MRGGERAEPGRRLPVRRTLGRVVLVYRRRPRFLVLVGVLVGIPIGLIDMLTGNVEGDPGSVLEAAGLFGTALGGFLLSLLAGQLQEGLIGEAAVEVGAGHPRPPLGRILRRLPYPRMVAVNVVYVLAVAAGTVLLLVPGLIAFVWLAPATALVPLERRGVRASLARSRALVRGSFWRVLLLVGGGYVLTSALGDLIEDLELWLLGDGFVGQWVVAASGEALLTPIAAVTTVIVTLELIELRGERVPVPAS